MFPQLVSCMLYLHVVNYNSCTRTLSPECPQMVIWTIPHTTPPYSPIHSNIPHTHPSTPTPRIKVHPPPLTYISMIDVGGGRGRGGGNRHINFPEMSKKDWKFQENWQKILKNTWYFNAFPVVGRGCTLLWKVTTEQILDNILKIPDESTPSSPSPLAKYPPLPPPHHPLSKVPPTPTRHLLKYSWKTPLEWGGEVVVHWYELDCNMHTTIHKPHKRTTTKWCHFHIKVRKLRGEKSCSNVEINAWSFQKLQTFVT